MQYLIGRDMKYLLKLFLAALMSAAALHNCAYSQMPSTTLRLMNVVQTDMTTISFELWLKNTSPIDLNYYIGQYFSGSNTITWASSGIGRVSLDYSTNYGANWVNIAIYSIRNIKQQKRFCNLNISDKPKTQK